MCHGAPAVVSHGSVSRSIGTEFGITRASGRIGETVRTGVGEYRAKPNSAAAVWQAFRRQRVSEMRRANEVASGCIDTGRNSRGFGARGFGARPTEAQESALGPALVAISEDASRVVMRVRRA